MALHERGSSLAFAMDFTFQVHFLIGPLRFSLATFIYHYIESQNW
jgi:hypothetical protein